MESLSNHSSFNVWGVTCVWRTGQGCPLELTRHKDGSIGMSLAQAVVKGHMRSKCLGLEVSF